MAPLSVLHSRFFVPRLSKAYKKSSVQAGARFASIDVFPINRTLK